MTGCWSLIRIIDCLMQDISENGADVAHLTTVHESGVQAGSAVDYANKWLGKVLTHNWKVRTERNPSKQSDSSERLCAWSVVWERYKF